MKIFRWSKVLALAQYADGEVIALATDREQAISMAVEEHRKDEKWELYTSTADFEAELRATEPEVFEGPLAFLIAGSA